MRAWVLLPLAVLSGCFSLDTDGDGIPDRFAPSGYEQSDLACADERDNDQDGRTDCEDVDCVRWGFCGEQIPEIPRPGAENTFEACSDGVDNDDDATFDCGDRGCQSIMELCCLSEVDDVTCTDGVDNDGNGFADCGDFSCRNNPYVLVCETECGAVPCDDDTAPIGCADGRDTDGDRQADCNDSDCACTEVCNPGCLGPEETAARCMDGVDNDANGYVDCADFGCSMNPDPEIADRCTGAEETTLEQCSNGLDDDGDNYPDCADFSCQSTTSGATPEAAEYCAARLENTLERCSDGADNDENGFTDCGDFSCSRSDDAAILDYCARFTETTIASCTDGIDNDHNGFADCADFSCDFVIVTWGVGRCTMSSECPAAQICYRGSCLGLEGPCSESASIDGSITVQGAPDSFPTDATLAEQIEMATAQCTDAVDNDGDGFTDCEDWECNYNPRVVNDAGDRPLCESAGGRTCLFGALAGDGCETDEDCAVEMTGSCALTGPAPPAGSPPRRLVCP